MFDEKEGCIVEHARATVWRRLRTQRDNEEIAALEPAPPDVPQA